MAVKDVSSKVDYIADENGTVKSSPIGSLAVMSSFNRIGGTWAGGSTALMTNILREEWGFQGFAITDYEVKDSTLDDYSRVYFIRFKPKKR